ncbi:MAG: hypothetical protein WBP12_05695, partial [Candidatus Saccharimonas sp.]
MRVQYVLQAINFASSDPRAVTLAKNALTDKAESVRYWAIGALACTLDSQFINSLEKHTMEYPTDAAA